MMSIRNLITAVLLCAMCCAGAKSAYGQRMYKQGDAIVLDCGPGSGFPQGAVETVKGKKIASGTPSTSSTLPNNKESESINATVYQKLEIAAANSAAQPWVAAYAYCLTLGKGWRLPTQRELELLFIFKDAVKDLGGAVFASDYYWSSTENTNNKLSSWVVNFSTGHTTFINFDKPRNTEVRCVREMD